MAQERLSTWRDNSRACAAIAKGALSVECADLLDRLLQKDEVRSLRLFLCVCVGGG
jgi:hypothetical protein